MTAIVELSDLAALLAFLAGFVMTLRMPRLPDGSVNAPKMLLASATGVYVLVMFSNVLEHAGITRALDAVEDYLEILFIPLLVYAVYAMFMRRQLIEAQRTARQLERSHEFTQSIVDTVPAGILILDTLGRITFSNEGARETLGLEDPDGSGLLRSPGALVRGLSEEGDPADFSALVGDVELRNTPVTVDWPNGRRVRLVLSTVPMYDEAERLAAVLASFIDMGEGAASPLPSSA